VDEDHALAAISVETPLLPQAQARVSIRLPRYDFAQELAGVLHLEHRRRTTLTLQILSRIALEQTMMHLHHAP